MTDVSRLELMMLFAAGALDAHEADEVRAMIAAGDPGVLADLAYAEAVLAHIPEALPPMDVPAGAKRALRERLVASATFSDVVSKNQPRRDEQAGAGAAGTTTPATLRIKPNGWRRAAALAAAVGLSVGVTWLVMSQRIQQQSNRLAALEQRVVELDSQVLAAEQRAANSLEVIEVMRQSTDAQARQIAEIRTERDRLNQSVAQLKDDADQGVDRLAQLEAQRNALSLSLESAQQTLTALATPTGRAVILPGTEYQVGAGARVVYDPPQNQVFVFAHDIGQPAPGQTYQLWVVTDDDRKVSLGTFVPDDQGNVAVRFDLPADPGPVKLAAVTNEPAGGSPQPTGNFQLIGEF